MRVDWFHPASVHLLDGRHGLIVSVEEVVHPVRLSVESEYHILVGRDIWVFWDRSQFTVVS